MGKTPADILESAAGFDEFREGILALKGCFSLEAEDMLRLGKLYFLRYPDASPDRIMENVHIGYRIVRTCMVEKLLEGIDERYHDTVRGMLDDFRLIDNGLMKLKREISTEEIESLVFVVERNLDRVRSVIDELPRGMIKERFVGGISKFYNDVYLLNGAVKKLRESGDGKK
jgi:hypothetical protein